ncbi:hypothetical protein ACJMK2_006901 [Sinanodonta woodiana]|uniref:Calponin-homology (CH) domain-containing protein n=1 Tax=Sinanodonta woodiana TaxID=1069815 RepID=A0ABD3VUK7_SINWO
MFPEGQRLADKMSKMKDSFKDNRDKTGMEGFDEAELEELYTWVDSIPLSRPKRNIGRDFADGVLVAEIIKHEIPPRYNLIELHNYTSANSATKKTENWLVLNRKVFSKLNFELADDVIKDIVTCKPGTIEKVLMMLRVKLARAEWELKRKEENGMNDKPEADQNMGSPGRKGKVMKVTMEDKRVPAQPSFKGKDGESSSVEHYPRIPKQKVVRTLAETDVVPRILLEEREQECLAKDETIKKNSKQLIVKCALFMKKNSKQLIIKCALFMKKNSKQFIFKCALFMKKNSKQLIVKCALFMKKNSKQLIVKCALFMKKNSKQLIVKCALFMKKNSK